MANMSDERVQALLASYTKGGRPIEELLTSRDPLKGAEAQRLRGYFTSYILHPADCQDFEFVAALMTANMARLGARWQEDLEKLGGGVDGVTKVIEKWEAYRDSPNQLPLFDILLVGAFTNLKAEGSIAERYFETLAWLIAGGISVEGTDIAGYTALQHSLTCTTLLHSLRLSTVLLAASADPIAAINHRNRYGATATHETLMNWKRPGEEEIRLEALAWSLARGANVDSKSFLRNALSRHLTSLYPVPDGDGSTARTTAARFQSFADLIGEHDLAQVTDGSCAFCRRGGVSGKGKGKDVPTGEGEIKASMRLLSGVSKDGLAESSA